VSSTPGERSIELIYELKTRARMVEPDHVARYARAVRSISESTGYHLEVEQPLERTPPGFGEVEEDPLEPFYAAIGCAMLALPVLGTVAAVIIAFVAVRRLNRRRAAQEAARAAAAPPAAPPAGCPRCGAVTPPDTRFCSACGTALAGPAIGAARRGSGFALEAVIAVGCGLLLLPTIGIVAAVFIPNFIDALGKARQKRTLADMQIIAANLEDHLAREGHYPSSAGDDETAATTGETGEIGVPHDLPTLDAWEHPFRYVCWRNEPAASGCDDYRLASAGADGEFEHDDFADYLGEPTERTGVDRDLVLGPEGVIQGPADP
jgi:type II secretory pathway pseudopilin PulG